jgi:hypothetical protein
LSEQRDKAREAFLKVVTNRLKAYVPANRAAAEARDARDEFMEAWGPEPRAKKTTRKKRSSK